MQRKWSKATGSVKSTLFEDFKVKQWLFSSLAKRGFEKRKLTQIEALLQQNCKKFWDAIHKLDREVPGRVVGTSVPAEIVLADGSVMDEESDVLHRWAEVFTQLFEMENAEQQNFTGAIDTNKAGVLSQHLLWEEVLIATQRLKNGKAAGWDGLVHG